MWGLIKKIVISLLRGKSIVSISPETLSNIAKLIQTLLAALRDGKVSESEVAELRRMAYDILLDAGLEKYLEDEGIDIGMEENEGTD